MSFIIHEHFYHVTDIIVANDVCLQTPCSTGTFSETEEVLVEQDQVIDKTEPEVKSRQSQSCSLMLNHNIDHDHCYSSFYQSSFDIGFVNVHKL